jgi:opacity protein-like surface antigen
MRTVRTVAIAAALLAAAAAPAAADGMYQPGVREVVPAPIPVPEPISVPAPIPVAEGYTYYLRADLGWAIQAGNPSFREQGNLFGAGPCPFCNAGAPFTFGQAPEFTANHASIDDIFFGSFGFGAYFLPHLRGDLTLDIRAPQHVSSATEYHYTSNFQFGGGFPINGTTTDNVRLSRVLGLASLYYDLLPHAWIQPYIGGSVGIAYTDASWVHANTEVPVGFIGTQTVIGTATAQRYGFAAAATAGVVYDIDQHWSVDCNYRAVYIDGVSIPAAFSNGQASRGVVGAQWEHEVRVGLRLNVW